MIPLWFKLAYSAFVLLIVVIWWRDYGWRNFLWFSDVAFIGAAPAMWLESSVLASVLAVTVLVYEMIWNVDFVGQLLLRRRITGFTDYMFEPARPLYLRVLSFLFHAPLPFVLMWLVSVYGYAAQVALPAAIALTAVVLVLSRWLGTREKNINWVYGLAGLPQPWPAPVWLLVLLAGSVLFGCVPADLILRSAF